MPEAPKFHLAYFNMNTQFFMSGRVTSEPLKYALVPLALEQAGPWKLKTVTATGQPSDEVIALPGFLRCLRRADVTGIDPVERRLIDLLIGRAYAANYVLPRLASTERMPPWSRMVLPKEVLVRLQQLGGAGDMPEVRRT